MEDEILQELRDIKKILNGNGSLGIVAKVQIIWHSYIWVFCIFSAGLGSVLTWAYNAG